VTDVITEANTADSDYLRMVLPVVVDYLDHIWDGADLDRLRRAATRGKAVRQAVLIDALIAAKAAAACLGRPLEEESAQAARHDSGARAVMFNAISRISSQETDGQLPIAARDAMVAAALDDLADHGYVVTYIGRAA
jgi:hypothetical protein